MPLTNTSVQALKSQDKAYRKSDGGGLYLEVTKTGSKLWRMAYRFGGKQKTLSFGVYPAVTLSEARQKRENAKSILASGQDPSVTTRKDKQQAKIAAGNTFAAIADELIEKTSKKGNLQLPSKRKDGCLIWPLHRLDQHQLQRSRQQIFLFL